MIRIGIPNRRGPAGFRAGALRAFAALSAAWLALSCIERTNPFDPLNGGDIPASVIRSQLKLDLDSLAAVDSVYPPLLTAFAEAFRKDSVANSGIILANTGKRTQNQNTLAANNASQANNLVANPDSLVALQYFSLLDTLKPFGPYPDFEIQRSHLQTQTATLTSFIANANANHSPVTVYSSQFSDSVLAPFVRDNAAFDQLRARVQSGNAAVVDSNALVRAYNAERKLANTAVLSYNDSITYVKQTHNKPPLARSDSLLAGTAKAQAGDTLLIAKGDFSVDLRFNHSGTEDKYIVVRGYPGGRTVLRVPAGASSAMILSANQFIRFQDIDFRGGVQLVAASSNIEFQRCVFDSGAVAGLRVVDSDVMLTDCRLTDNAKGAFIQGTKDGAASFSMKNVLVARNGGHGLEMNIPKGTIHNCTISDNGGDGINVSVPHAELNISNSIISGNAGIGIIRQRDTEFQDRLNVGFCDVWGNKTADWSLVGMDTTLAMDVMKANFSIQPEFIDPANLDYDIRPGSVLAEFEHQSFSFVVGYRP